MCEENNESLSRSPRGALQRIDEICDAFEARWLGGDVPLIEDYVEQVPPDEQPRLFRGLLELDVDYRSKRDDTTIGEDYWQRFPSFEQEIRGVISSDFSLTQISDVQGMSANTHRQCEETMRLSESIEERTAEINGYEMISEIARGGMGIVYKARQIDANRIVALKMILSGTLAGEKEVARFKIEAESAASLDHPNIVPIYDVGESKGIHYFSMGFVDGPSLKDYRKKHPLSPRRSAAIVKTIAESIAHAHSKGIVHRDLKPANILIDESGNPRITDFGLSKILEGQTELTGTGQLLGTPAYMSPEQASGLTSQVGPLADVYSLGAMLYELVSGRTPFQSESIIGMLEQVCWQDPDSLQTHSREADRDIESICMKCLEKEPSRRYRSALALADDLGRYLEGSPIVARPTSGIQKFVRWCRRKPLIAGLAACSFLTFLVLGSTTAYFAFTSNANSSIADVERQRNDISLSIAQNAVDQMVEQAKLLEDVPRTTLQRKEFLANATDFYEGFLEQRPDDPELQHQSAVLHRSMGDVFRSLGEVQPASDAYEQSIVLLRRLSNAEPDRVTHKEQLRESYLWLGVLLNPTEAEQAMRAINHAFAIQSELNRVEPGSSSNEYGLARVLYNRGLLLSERGDVELAEADYQSALEGFEKVLPVLDQGQQRECRLYLSHVLNNFSTLLKTAGDYEQAMAKVKRAIDLLSEIGESRKERFELAIYRNNLSNIFAAAGELDNAIVANQKSTELLEELVEEYPHYPDLKNSLGNAFNSHGSLAGRNRQLSRAAEFFQKAEVVFRQLLDEHPGHLVYSDRLGNSKYNSAVVQYMEELHEAASKRVSQALTLHRHAFESNPENVEFEGHLRNDYALLIKLQRSSGNFAAIEKSVDECLAVMTNDTELRLLAAQWLASGIGAIRDQEEGDTESNADTIETLGAKAVEQLTLARQDGPTPNVFDGDEIVSSLQPLADRKDFQELLAEIAQD